MFQLIIKIAGFHYCKKRVQYIIGFVCLIVLLVITTSRIVNLRQKNKGGFAEAGRKGFEKF